MDGSRIRRWLLPVAALPALWALGWAGYLAYLGARTVRAVFLPYNFQDALHVVEVGLLAALGLYLVASVAGRSRDGTLRLRLSDGRRVPLRPTQVIGSGPEADVVVSGSSVSRRHLAIHRGAGGQVEAIDLGSTNGTFRDREDLRRRGRVALRPGDRLRLGRGEGDVELVACRDPEEPAGGPWGRRFAAVATTLFLWVGLFLGWRANLDRLPEAPVSIGRVTLDFAVFRDPWPALWLALAAAVVVWALADVGRRRPRSRVAVAAVALFLVVGIVVLYPLLPASGWRYAQAAVRALDGAGIEAWQTLETWERDGGRPERWLREPAAELVPPPPDLGPGNAGRPALRRYVQGRAALRWASNLGAEQADPWYAITYFRQVAALLAATLLMLYLPARWKGLRAGLERLPDGLSRPLSRRLVRTADRGALWAQFLRPVAYWDVLLGFGAAAVVAITLWTPLGSTQGRGKSLYLELPGIATVQSVEIVKALFVLFMAGYFARHGTVLAKAPRRRYLVPYLLAVLITLALTGVQADLGALFMLGLFLTLVFVAATGSWRKVASVPLLVFPAVLLAWGLGMTSIIGTRLGIWLSPRTHPLGEQIVQARQLFLSSGWSGHPAYESRAWLLPDVQGDLVVAALAERFGLLGLAALIAAWFAFGAALLASARHAGRSRSILLASVAAVVLVQVLTQVGGATGLLPLTGVPIPWISHGLTASLVFTALCALAVLALPAGASPSPARAASSLGQLRWLNAAACGLLAAAAAYWTVWLPSRPGTDAFGADYRWQSQRRADELERWVSAGLFVAAAGGRRVEIDPAAYRRYATAAGDPGLLRLIATVDGLSMVAGELRARSFLTTNPNRFADRGPSRGRILSADGAVLAMNGRRSAAGGGRRVYPLGAAAFHPVGYGGSGARSLGVEAAARRLLRAGSLDGELARQAFWNDVHSGPDVTLTLRSDLQRLAYRLLDGRRGAAVVMDLSDGALLAATSSPAPDASGASVADWLRLARAADRPLRNRVFHSTDVYSPPGSVFKVVVAAAALLHDDAFDPRRRLVCHGYDGELRVSCAHGRAHGRVDLERALRASCNVYFARAAVALGAGRLRDAAGRFGFNPGAPVDLAAGLPDVRLAAGTSQALGDPRPRLTDRDLARVGYGQGPVSATPLDVARMGAAIAGGGSFYEPYLTRALSYSRQGEIGRQLAWEREVAEPVERRVLPERIAARLLRPLRGVFESADGTGRRLPRLWRGPEGWRLGDERPGDGWRRVALAGKTGSAWKTRTDTEDDAWMVAWAPAEDARVVAAILVEDAGEGAKVAGPIALAALAAALNLLDGFPALGDDDVSNPDV